jgi:hypothetical protein
LREKSVHIGPQNIEERPKRLYSGCRTSIPEDL